MERKIEFNVTGKERGLLAKAIGEFLGVEVRYLRVPTCNYDIGGSILDRNGTFIPADKTMVGRYNDIYRGQMPNVTPHVCRHTYCSNQAKAGMNPKTLQYLMANSDISVTMNMYTHIGFDDAEEELKKMEEFRKAQEEIERKKEKPTTQKMFKVV